MVPAPKQLLPANLGSRLVSIFALGTSFLACLQWDTVKSVVKSVAGLQGRKFKARQGWVC